MNLPAHLISEQQYYCMLRALKVSVEDKYLIPRTRYFSIQY